MSDSVLLSGVWYIKSIIFLCFNFFEIFISLKFLFSFLSLIINFNTHFLLCFFNVTLYTFDSPPESKYSKLVPQLNLITQQYTYEPNNYNYINKESQLDLPTKEELEIAYKYKDKIPDYQISNGDDQNKEGVIIDNPNYSSYNENEPPTTFKPISGEIGLDESQVNEAGAAPVDFGQPDFRFNVVQSDNNNINNGFIPSKPRY